MTDASEGKSVFSADPRIAYCTNHSIQPHPAQAALTKATVEKHPWAIMLGAPEALHLCSNLIRLTKAKRCIDIGVFTGASSLAWGLAIPEDGEVFALDIQRKDYDEIGAKFLEEAGVAHKIKWRVGPAVKSLDALIQEGETGKFDFAFIDAEKTEYPDYYEKCVQLLRSGGIIAIDNALQKGNVYLKKEGEMAGGVAAVNKLNGIIHADERVENTLLGMADGLHLVFKK